MARTVSNPKLSSRTARLPLKARREPYWQPIVKGCAVGYRKGAKGGTWVARWRTPEGKHVYKAIGPADDVTDDGSTSLAFDQAQEKARDWFGDMARTRGARSLYTVGEALDDYIQYLQRDKAESTAYDAQKRANKWIRPKLGDTAVSALQRTTLNEWWGSLLQPDKKEKTQSKDSANHVLTVLKAALNRAAEAREQEIPSTDAWRKLKPHKGASQARRVVLDKKQIDALLKATSGGFRQLVLAALLTGARPPGELAKIRAGDVDLYTGTITIRGKTGIRTATMDDAMRQFFKEISKGKQPHELLFVKDDGSIWGKNHHIRPWAEAASAAKLPSDATMYCTRHTHISQRLLKGVVIHLLASELGTSVAMIEKHYAKYLVSERRQALNATSFMDHVFKKKARKRTKAPKKRTAA